MPDIELEALEAALETDQINLNVDRFQVSGGDWQTLDDLTADQRSAYDARAANAPLERARRVAVMSRFDFAAAAAEAEFVTYAESAQWAAGNALPAPVQAVINALPSEQQGPAMLDALARPEIRRNGSLMPALATAFGTDDAGLDALFRISV